MQAAFKEALAQADKATREAQLAQARAEAAQNRAQALLYQIMALLKLSPEEWKPVVDEKGLRFEQVKSPESAKKK
jgi:hypothetical protein